MQQVVIRLDDIFNDNLARGFNVGCDFIGDGNEAGLCPQVVFVPGISFHGQQVDDTPEICFTANWPLDGYWIRLQPILNHANRADKICPHTIHLVNKADTRHAILVSLSPNRFRLGFNASNSIEHYHATIQNAQAALHFGGEVDVSRGVDDVDLVVQPEGSRRRRRNRNTALLLLHHVVHRGRAVVNLTHPMYPAGVVQNSLCGCCFASINVGDDADITNFA